MPRPRERDRRGCKGDSAGDDYGKRPYTPTPETAEELGDCLFSLLALCCELDVDAEGALSGALEKYGARLRRKGDAGSR